MLISKLLARIVRGNVHGNNFRFEQRGHYPRRNGLARLSGLARMAAKPLSRLSSSSPSSPLLRYAMIVVATLCIAGCEKEPTREEILRKQREDFIKAKAGLEKMKADAEAQRRDQEEKFSKTIGGAMMKQAMEAASGKAKKNTEADDKVRRALDRDFGVPQKKQ